VSRTSSGALLRRHPGNPILTGAAFPAEARIQRVFNAGVIQRAGRTVMACRVEDRALRNSIWMADSDDGVHFVPRPGPVELPYENGEFAEYAGGMIYDPRITELEGSYYLVHAAHSRHGCRLSLVRSSDLSRFEWLGFISETDNRNGVLFPEKIGGLYARLDRPNTGGEFGDIWISYSPDLVFWGKSRCVLRNGDVRWAWAKIGPGAVPIKTREGWLNVFHGVRWQCKSHYVYQLGVALHDLDDPSRVIALCKEAILEPEELYELVGQTPSVVFTSGAVVEPDGEVKVYYGGADTVMALATTTVDELLYACKSL
jgi:predicted GH43/DUF377 family glycosyl hydrolase